MHASSYIPLSVWRIGLSQIREKAATRVSAFVWSVCFARGVNTFLRWLVPDWSLLTHKEERIPTRHIVDRVLGALPSTQRTCADDFVQAFVVIIFFFLTSTSGRYYSGDKWSSHQPKESALINLNVWKCPWINFFQTQLFFFTKTVHVKFGDGWLPFSSV